MYGPIGGLGASAASVAALSAGAGEGAVADVLPNAGSEKLIEAALLFVLVTGIVITTASIARIRAAKD